MEIRAEKPDDILAIRQVNIAAFGRDNEADLVDRLRNFESTFSFVAVESNQIVGHIFFSPVGVEGECDNDQLILGLAPMAVLPNRQRQGIGTSLVQHSLQDLAQKNCTAIVVLGHPDYYPRFGFIPAKVKGLTCEYEVPDEAFMVKELQSSALQECRGTVKYRPEFRDV